MSAGKLVGLFLVLLFVVAALPSSAQKGKSKAQLQKEKQQNLEKIKETERILNETATQKKNSLGELSALNQRILQQEQLIGSIKGEISLLDRDIDEDSDMIDALQKDVKELKKEYAAMVFSAQKANNKVDQLTFLFSSQSFDQLSMRLKYMQQYSKARKDQAEAIARTQKILESQIRQTETVKISKSSLLNDELKENKSLSSLKVKQRSVVRSLQKEERRLRSDIDETRKSVAALDRLIDEIIREEIARAEREAREARARAAAPKVDATAIALSASFEENKRKFTWPASGFISQKFGKQAHPALKGIVINNNGINIQTRQDEKVKCIFNGEVRQVATIGVIGNSVIINHGDYYSVYAGLKEVFVKRGDKVTANQEIGQLMVNGDGVSELRFMIYKNNNPPTALDPQLWLRN
jgi:septal ring factor EnvC (AmiA/AmiB activator)